ncbi:hypothetical protein D7Y13_36145 [Corallococcus praedator]|uniref:DUF2092 domain-containing protein n=1 Tax=Corallococcus praedator TaxID=2316724 RepID=A0ABX9Q9U9_9BACT|nr:MULTISPECIES: hypothetical protein [Corallococcus]RKH10464.1 hypothetical protein D7X74_27470 [Corallococcus sp. CA047B]RKH24393.1 hypothetical protein D7X75_32025 [Corallococcus sp. CA031C]RKH92587.1 hypothetical protein D7Y13_36145 [Corallococcus praedator]
MKRFIAVSVVLASLTAGAYVLPGGSILRRMATAREEKRLSAFRVEGSVIFSSTAVPEAGAVLNVPTERTDLQGDGVLSVKIPGRCRFDVSSPESSNKAATVQVSGRKRVEGKELPAVSVLVAQVCALLAQDAGSVQDTKLALEAYLQGLGIDTKRTSLARFGGEVAYVLGDPAEGKPQFWVYKDAFRAARVRYNDTAGTAWDVRFVDYTAPATGDWMPRTVEVWKAGQRVVRFTALKADNRSAVSDKLFTP